MKWTIMQLNRYVNTGLKYKETVSLQEYANKDIDIIRMDDCDVEGSMQIVDEKYIFDFTFNTTIYMECAITLEEVPVQISETVTEIFSNDEEDNEIDGITIDLKSVLWLNILAYKPMRVVKDGVESPFETERKKEINPAFKDLKKYL